jgi:hypothetical protein
MPGVFSNLLWYSVINQLGQENHKVRIKYKMSRECRPYDMVIQGETPILELKTGGVNHGPTRARNQGI